MTRSAKLALTATVLLVGGSLAAHLAFALYLRSNTYLRRVEAGVGDYFQMPCDMRGITRMTFSSTGFDGVEIWLPDRRDRVFHCARAVWNEFPVDHGVKVNLDLLHGTLALGTDKWLLEDYRTVLESGLRHDFDLINQVRLEDFAISFRRKNLLLHADKATGTIVFETPELGIASLESYGFNGTAVREPIRIHARFLPQGKTLIDEMSLEIPEVALSGLKLDQAIGSPVTRGYFAGRLAYREAVPQPQLTLSGRLYDIDLAELTARLPTGPLHGSAEVTLDKAVLQGALPVEVRGRARLGKVMLADFGPLFGVPNLSGAAELNISEAILEHGHVTRLVINGQVRNVELVDVLRLLGRGEATGRLTIAVNGLRIEQDRIVSADIDVFAAPAPGAVGTIGRDLLLSAAERVAGFTWPSALPKRLLPGKIEYAQFGLRLLVSDNQLRVLGTHGSDGETILTIRVLGNDIGLVRQWAGTTDLTPWIEDLMERISAYDPRDVRRLLKPASAPSNRTAY